MKRFLGIAVLVLSVFFVFIGHDARAEDKKMFNVKFSVVANTDLEGRDINILLEYEDKNTALITLKAIDNYTKEQPLLEGKATVKEITILGNIGQYECKYDGNLDISDNKEFVVTVNKKELKSVGQKIEKDTSIPKTAVSPIEKKKSEEKVAKKGNGYKESLIVTGKKILKTVLSASIAIVIVIAGFLIYKWKRGIK